MKRLVFVFTFSILLMSCNEKKSASLDFPFFLDEKCMIVNTEQDNTIEGTYLKVLSDTKADSIKVNLPDNFFVDATNFRNWVIGWGGNVPLYDAGVENLREIDTIYPDNSIKLGKLKRGRDYPKKGQRIVFWNTKPARFTKQSELPIIDLNAIENFHGQNMQFGAIVFDSVFSNWVMFINECGGETINTYTLFSKDLHHWDQGETKAPLFTPEDFKNIAWANGKSAQTPLITDVVRYNKLWYLFMDAYDSDGKRHIGLATAKDISDPYTIAEKPLVSPGGKGSWNDNYCFYAQVCRYKNNFIMFYDGRNSKGEENVGMATSENLYDWRDYSDNPVITDHLGWRSSLNCSEPIYTEVHGDSIFLMVAGAKKFKMGWWHHYISRRMYLDVSGNVDDTQLGVYLSTDGGKSFIPHKNNPVFTNNYADTYENGHMGGGFELIKTDTAAYLFYMAKNEGSGYKIFLREKK